ncbi:NINE protein [Apibacter sp. B3889]|uniref:TM2 domain-containing protein n=1 Tax=unclassified Apibacter TaxID=2630820 RepID=UPI001326B30B|nr:MULTISPECIES: TM2 domain-containing protein [unclassified Apibacter]MXO33721.1 NINE protein [Apibacter sp. B3883]MXO41078.1 NINE protein [Apibacter sp. B3889]MXP04247.1 NINE protein [Apibacter sp. B3887]MXP06942.1 NINE protein [Apibacter sp. B3935]
MQETNQINNINNDDYELSKDQIRISNIKKLIAGIFAILLGSLGIHKFYLGYIRQGIITLIISFFCCGIGAIIMSTIGMIEGIIYITQSDKEFYNTYVKNRKGWF